MLDVKLTLIALEQLQQDLSTEDIGLESYLYVHRILDTFGRLLSNLKVSLIHFNNSFKRSELVLLHDSRRLLLAHTNRIEYFDPKLMVPIPSGMHTSYIKAATILEGLYSQIAIMRTVDSLREYLENLTLTDPTILTKNINKITINELSIKLNAIFTTKKTEEVPLGTVIANYNEITTLDKMILQYQDYYKNTDKISKQLNIIESIIDSHVTNLEKQTITDRNFIIKFHDLVRVAAIQFDAYGVVLHNMQMLEHNFVILLKKLSLASVHHSQ